MTSSLIKPLRVDHWTKNLVLILEVIFAIFMTTAIQLIILF